MTSINDLVNALTSNDFSSTDVQNAILASILLCESVTDIEYTENSGVYTISDKAHQNVVTQLTVDILVNMRMIIKSRRENVTVRSNQEIFNSTYRQLLITTPINEASDGSDYFSTMFGTNTNPTETWED